MIFNVFRTVADLMLKPRKISRKVMVMEKMKKEVTKMKRRRYQMKK